MNVPSVDQDIARATLGRFKDQQQRMQRSLEMASRATAKFRDFVPIAWPSVEPSREYIPSWHMGAIGDHLQALADGQIKNLLITVPPGTSKSILAAVMFPAWMWLRRPGWRSTFASYDAALSGRDSERCRGLLKSLWYKETFRPDWKFSPTQDEKTYYVNTAKGFRVSTSVTGKGTGWRGDAIICLGYDTPISTEGGKFPIGRIVDEQIPLQVWAFNHRTGKRMLRDIEAYESSPGRASIRIGLSNGMYLEPTTDHPFYVGKRGYIQAKSLKIGDRLLHESELSSVREGDLQDPIARGQGQECILQQSMLLRMGEGGEQFSIRWGTNQEGLHSLRGEFLCGQGQTKAQRKSGLLLQPQMHDLPLCWEKSCKVRKSTTSPMYRMRTADKTTTLRSDRGQGILLSPMCRQGAGEIYAWEEQSQLHAWHGERRIPCGVQKDCSQDSETRQVLQALRENESGGRECAASPPHRLRQAAQLSHELDNPVQKVSFERSWYTQSEDRSQGVTVVSIEPIATPDRVFNIRIAEDHNYFANGVLLHNCDDPLNAKERNSDAVLNACVDWWSNVMFNRLNDLSTGIKLIIMQRLGDRDLAGHVLRQGGYEHLMIPMEYDPTRSRVTSIGWRDPRTQKDELMFPQLFPRAVVDELKLNPSTYAGQYQQSPNVDGGGILKSNKWKYWKPAGMNLPPVRVKLPNGDIEVRAAVDLPDDFDFQMQSWDFSFKDLKTSDYVVGQVHAVRGANRFILDQIRGRMSFTESVAAVRELTGRRPKAHLKLVEDKANGPAVIDTLRNEISGLVEFNSSDSKVGRATAASVELEAGNWHLPHPMIAPWVGNPENPTEGGFIAESVLFPYAANDDCVDSWSMGALRIQKEKGGSVFPMSESDVRVQRPEISDKWPRLMGLYSDYKTLAAVWIVRQPDTGLHIAYADYLTANVDPVEQAKALRAKGAWIPGVIASEESQIKRREVYAVAQKLSGNGLSTIDLTRVAEPEILQLRDAFQAKMLQVVGGCNGIFDQYRLFRRDDNGKLPTDNHGLIMALAAAWRERSRAVANLGRTRPSGRAMDSMGWATR